MQLDKNFTAKGKGLMKCVDIVHGKQYMCQHNNTSACISCKKNKKKSHVFMSLKNNDNLYNHS